MRHNWVPSTLGHGNKMCNRCWATDLEAEAIGLVECDAAPKPANENVLQDKIDEMLSSADDGTCPACGGSGVAEDECECMDDTCCCLYQTPPVCSVCGGSG